jgi:3-methyl-2-oxobutanoate hydroxymethyltransferase
MTMTKPPPAPVTEGPSEPHVARERPVTVPDFLSAKAKGQRLAVLTAYDYSQARLLDEAGVDAILVGDSLGMVVQGHANCLPVTLEEMIYHARLVARGVRRALLIVDMPFMSYQVSVEEAVRNAGRLVKEGGAQAVKLEGGVRLAEHIAAIARADIPVMGHVGLTPQSVHRLGGFRVQRDEERLLADAQAVERAGAFSLVIECVPADVARRLTQSVRIPTIGIGAGAGCDGQVLVLHDLLGLFPDLQPRFVKRYAELGSQITDAVRSYCQDVRGGKFPAAEQEFK